MNQVHGVIRKSKRKRLRPIDFKNIENNHWEDAQGRKIDSQHLLISMLLPPAVKAFFEELESEVRVVWQALESLQRKATLGQSMGIDYFRQSESLDSKETSPRPDQQARGCS